MNRMDADVVRSGHCTLTRGKLLSALMVALFAVVANTTFRATAAPDSLTNGLVAYWNFDGNLYDSISDFHGTARGPDPLEFVDGPSTNFGKALKLDGTNFVEITGGNSKTNLQFAKGSLSIAGWFKVDAFDKS